MRQPRIVFTSSALLIALASCAVSCSGTDPVPDDDDGSSGGQVTTSTGGTDPSGGGGTNGSGGDASLGGETGSGCPGFSQTAAPDASAACGGEPFGTWRSTEVGWTSWQRDALTDSAETQVSVGVRVVAEGGYRASFRDGGELTWFSEAAAIDHVFTTCPGTLKPFTDPDFVPFGCEDLLCGCVCSTEVEEDLTDGTWSRDDTTLTITLGSEYPFDVGYCITGDEMTLLYPDGRTVVLERVYEVVTPTPCAGRTIDECVGACTAGKCVGDASCDSGGSETECLTLQGCTWDPGQCSGTEQSSCTLGEFDEVPGCTFVASAHCEGTPDPCWSMSEDACEAQLGCVAEWSCGGDPVPCSEGYGEQAMCEELVGCTYDEDSYECQGTEARCEDLPAECGDYGTLLGCEGSPCSGAVTPCEELDSLTCGTVQGCTLVVD
jgi:hypothetical protein